MKKIILSFGILLGLGGVAFIGQTAHAEDVDLSNALWRVYNPNSGEHFFTENESESNWLSDQGWKTEGVAWFTPEKGEEVYRLYNPNVGDHFYTKSVVEYDWLHKNGWVQEGKSFLSDTNKSVPVYRSYNKNALAAGAHMFTISENEQDGLLTAGWLNEGTPFYAVSAYSHLESRIAYCRTLKEEDYDASAFSEFQLAITDAENVLNNSASTQEELTTATNALYNALDKLLQNPAKVD